MEYESKINVIDALIMESMKLQMIMNESESSADFQIYQESFAKPDKNESTLTKVALAVPRFIYMLIKTIIDGFKLTRPGMINPQEYDSNTTLLLFS